MSALGEMVFDLVADDPTQYRSLAETDWETIRGKRNRIAIGDPICRPEHTGGQDSLLTEEDLAAHRDARPDFFRISFPVTLLPDVDCQFRFVDTKLSMAASATSPGLPLFIRLAPARQSSKVATKIKLADKAKVAVKDPILKVFSGELASDQQIEKDFERIDFYLESFGLRTREAGWRIQLKETRDIALSTDQLNILVALPKGERGKIRFQITADILIKTAIDRVLSKLFLGGTTISTSAAYEFP